MGRKRRRRTSAGAEIFQLAFSQRWPLAAGLSLLALVAAYVLIPLLLGANQYTSALVPVFRPFLLLMAGVFAAIAVFKYVRERVMPASHISPASGAFRQGSRLSRDPQAAAFIQSLGQSAAEHARPAGWSAEIIQRMEWLRFEEVCAAYCQAKGMRAQTTSLGADGGVDIRLYEDPADPLRCTGVIQCKAWGERYVGVKPVRELRGVMAHENVAQGFFMSQSPFTAEAQAFARENQIELIDGEKLLSLIRALPEADAARLLAFATEGDWTTPSCPHCGTKMVLRAGANGDFWGCANYPRCRQKLNVRSGWESGLAS